MLPTAHIELTWGTLSFLQRRGMFEETDYRLVALGRCIARPR